MMKKTSFFALSAISLALAGCGGSDDAQNQEGSLTLSGVAALGQVLTATPADPDGIDESTLVFTWFANGNVIDGETGPTYTIPASGGADGDLIQNDTQISAAVVYTDNAGFTEGHNSGLSAEIGVEIEGEIAVTGIAQSGEILTAVLTDANGISDGNVAYSWQADGVDIAGETASTLLLTDEQLGTSVTATVIYADDDGFTDTLVSDAIGPVIGEGVNTPAEFSGLAVSLSNDTAESITGTVTITDINPGEAAFVPVTDQDVALGVFSITEAGAWTFTLDTANENVAGLASSTEFLTSVIALESVDGTVAEFVVTVVGVDTVNTRAVFIRDTDANDTGELRYSIVDTSADGDVSGLAQGRIEVDFTRTDDDITGNSSVDAFISLFNSGNNNAGAILDLRVRDNNFGVRSPEFNVSTDLVVPSLSTDSFNTAVITWEYPEGDTSVQPSVSVEIDGVPISDGGDNTSPFVPENDAFGGVTTLSFRLGSNANASDPEAFFGVDNVRIFSDVAGNSPLFIDTFEDYAVGEDLDSDNNPNSPYSTSTSEAVIELLPGQTDDGNGGDEDTDSPDTGAVGNQVAAVSDTDTGDTGELRLSLSDLADFSGDFITTGRVTLSVLREEETTGEDGFVALFGTSTSSDNSLVELRLETNSDEFQLRNQDSITIDTPFVEGTWYEIEMSWDATDSLAAGSAGGVSPLITVSIDGVPVTTDAFASASNADLSTIFEGLRTLQFRNAGGSAIADSRLLVDNIVLYSSDSGSEVEVFSDDFESYTVGESLDPNDDSGATIAADTPYHNNSFQAVVVEEQ
ncbi:VCBS domain-containing protein [Alteromonas sp. 5E99-2]|uniref:VCBS domain-containing protein n=1 Tax=Alteromonas sp. 5E99-2 TaxID=2817683 RepID=UPI001A9855C6|nr:VCBS domain-containing protein [Alteromonas sp. 5E99-2]MBO1256568.1 VCBS domain-containing protein [Alteromonas sp. 5E99-2]